MSKIALSQNEIKNRLIRLRNLETLHADQKIRNKRLETENIQMRGEILNLKTIVTNQQKIIQDLKLQIEELRSIVFGKKKPKTLSDENSIAVAKIKRNKDSYKRQVPPDNEVTTIEYHPIDLCNHCYTPVARKKIVTYYEEDIPLSLTKTCIKHIVEKGYCTLCRKWNTSIVLPAHRVILGNNIQKYICYLTTICRLSYSQAQQLLYDSYQIKVSEGEIAKILQRQGKGLRVAYEQLKESIQRESGVHLDETSWKILNRNESAYAWVMSGVDSKESIFLLGESRGKGNVEKLLGDNYTGFVVSDDYGAYKKLPNHQLCFAHPLRKFRDLALSSEITEEQINHNKEVYSNFSSIYSDISINRNPSMYDIYKERLTIFSQIDILDCQKMRTLKITLLKNIPKYLLCLTNTLIPLTNNQAERSLRHLVLKRKVSLGSLTKKGAETTAILLSIMMSMRQRYQENFFSEWLRV